MQKTSRLLFPIFFVCLCATVLFIARPAAATQQCQLNEIPQTCYVADQLIVLGLPDEITLATQPISDVIEFAGAVQIPWFFNVAGTHPLAGQGDVEAQIYFVLSEFVPQPEPVVYVAEQVNEAGLLAFASPNYITAAAMSWYIEGAPDVPAVTTAVTSDIKTQAAFTQIGYTTTIVPTGADIAVGIFDTSPFLVADGMTSIETLQTATLAVNHMSPLPVPSPVPTATDYSQHGTMVASLVHALVPSAEISLHRVLNNGGVGDLVALLVGLTQFVDSTLPALEDGSLAGAVVNLSLVVQAPSSDPVLPLELLLAGMNDVGMVIVAAAGNESDEGGALGAKVPAAYPFTLAVAGANSADNRACFSHRGDIAAGSGEALEEGDCNPPMLSESLRGWSIEDDEQLLWSGTSFAAPLVSGAAALVMDKRGTANDPSTIAQILYDTARDVGEDDFGSGILNIGDAINATVPLAVQTHTQTAAAPFLWAWITLLSLCILTLYSVRTRKP